MGSRLGILARSLTKRARLPKGATYRFVRAGNRKQALRWLTEHPTPAGDPLLDPLGSSSKMPRVGMLDPGDDVPIRPGTDPMVERASEMAGNAHAQDLLERERRGFGSMSTQSDQDKALNPHYAKRMRKIDEENAELLKGRKVNDGHEELPTVFDELEGDTGITTTQYANMAGFAGPDADDVADAVRTGNPVAGYPQPPDVTPGAMTVGQRGKLMAMAREDGVLTQVDGPLGRKVHAIRVTPEIRAWFKSRLGKDITDDYIRVSQLDREMASSMIDGLLQRRGLQEAPDWASRAPRPDELDRARQVGFGRTTPPRRPPPEAPLPPPRGAQPPPAGGGGPPPPPPPDPQIPWTPMGSMGRGSGPIRRFIRWSGDWLSAFREAPHIMGEKIAHMALTAEKYRLRMTMATAQHMETALAGIRKGSAKAQYVGAISDFNPQILASDIATVRKLLGAHGPAGDWVDAVETFGRLRDPDGMPLPAVREALGDKWEEARYLLGRIHANERALAKVRELGPRFNSLELTHLHQAADEVRQMMRWFASVARANGWAQFQDGDPISHYFPHITSKVPGIGERLGPFEFFEQGTPNSVFFRFLHPRGYFSEYSFDIWEALRPYTIGFWNKMFMEPLLKQLDPMIVQNMAGAIEAGLRLRIRPGGGSGAKGFPSKVENFRGWAKRAYDDELYEVLDLEGAIAAEPGVGPPLFGQPTTKPKLTGTMRDLKKIAKEELEGRLERYLRENVERRVPEAARESGRWNYPMNPLVEGFGPTRLKMYKQVLKVWAGQDMHSGDGIVETMFRGARGAFEPMLQKIAAHTPEEVPEAFLSRTVRGPGLALNNAARGAMGDAGTYQSALQVAYRLNRNVYRATLGGNLGSVWKNFHQIVNTVGEIGLSKTLKGIALMTTPQGRRLAKYADVMGDFMGIFEKAEHLGGRFTLDKLLFAPFTFSENMLRGVSFLGVVGEIMEKSRVPFHRLAPAARWQIMDKGLRIAELTQFIYSRKVRQPWIATNPIAALFSPFIKWPYSQTELLARWTRMFVNGMRGKEGGNVAPLIRFILATGYMTEKARKSGFMIQQWHNPVSPMFDLAAIPIGAVEAWDQDRMNASNFRRVEMARSWRPPIMVGLAGLLDLSTSMAHGDDPTQAMETVVRTLIPAGVAGMRGLRTAQAWRDGALYDGRGRPYFRIPSPDSNELLSSLFGVPTVQQVMWRAHHRGLTEYDKEFSRIINKWEEKLPGRMHRRDFKGQREARQKCREELMVAAKKWAKKVGHNEPMQEATNRYHEFLNYVNRLPENIDQEFEWLNLRASDPEKYERLLAVEKTLPKRLRRLPGSK